MGCLAYVAIGANLGDAQAQVMRAIQALSELPQTQLLQSSSLYQTEPVASAPTLADLGGDYINAVVKIKTSLSASELLSMLQKTERQAGRERSHTDAPRTLDLDLLLYGDARFNTPQLQLPHPRMNQRAFVLVPLHEVQPQLVTPEQLQAVSGQKVRRLV